MNTLDNTTLSTRVTPYESFNQLLKDVRDKAGYSIAAMARETGVHRNTQVNYETDRDPNIDYLVAFSDLTNISFWQLIAQRVRLGKSEEKQIKRALDEVGPLFSHPKVAPQEVDDLMPASQTLLETCQGLLTYHQHNQGIEVYKQQGNSMSPTINEGDSLLIDITDKTPRDGQLFFVKIADMYVARRFQNLPDGGILIIGDNSQFESMKVEAQNVDKVAIVGRVVSSISNY